MTFALSAVWWALKNWKLMLAGLAVVLFLGFLRHVDQQGYQRRINEEKAQEIALLHGRIDTLTLVADLDTKRALADAQLNNKDESLTLETPPNAGACLPSAAVSRLRAIGANGPVAAPAPARRYPKLLPLRSGVAR